MGRTDAADAYLNEVLAHVRWKKAHTVIQRELCDHIEDARLGFLAQGMSDGEAQERAVAEMGDAADVGARFDKAYRPAKNYGVWAPFLLIMAAGFFFRSVRAGQPEFTVFTLLLPAVFAAAYFVPFPRLVKFAWPLYGVYLLSLAATFLGPLVGNHFPIYIYYPPMFFPALYAILIYKERGRGALGILLLVAALLAQFLVYFYLSGILVAILTCVCLVQLLFAVLLGGFSCKKWLTALILLVPTAAIGLLFLVAAFSASGNTDTAMLVRDILTKMPWFGKSDTSLFSQLEHHGGTWRSIQNFFLVFAASRRGRIIFVIVGGLFAAFFAFTLRVCFKQKSMLYRLASLGITLHLFVQFIGYFLTNLGLTSYFAYPLPFVSDGDAAMLCNAALMGLLFSMLYNGSLVDDEALKKLPRWRIKLVKETV